MSDQSRDDHRQDFGVVDLEVQSSCVGVQGRRIQEFTSYPNAWFRKLLLA